MSVAPFRSQRSENNRSAFRGSEHPHSIDGRVRRRGLLEGTTSGRAVVTSESNWRGRWPCTLRGWPPVKGRTRHSLFGSALSLHPAPVGSRRRLGLSFNWDAASRAVATVATRKHACFSGF